MKIIKLTVTLILFIIGVTALLSLIMPVRQTVERSITINVPAQNIYGYLKKLENINTWAIWNQHDSTLKYRISGNDGSIGAVSTWTGNPQISGDGKIEITALTEPDKIEQSIQFLSPEKGQATSTFLLNEKNGSTTLTWIFSRATPRPWNIFNLISDIDKQMGKDFEEGLTVIKNSLEKKGQGPAPELYHVGTMNFPATSFAAIRQQVKWSDMASFYATHFPLLLSEAATINASPGTPAGLFYLWDEKNQLADMAAAVPVTPGAAFKSDIIRIVNIPASKALYINYYGAYNQTAAAYQRMDHYIAEKNLKQKYPVIEQYITDPVMEKDTARWLTKIVFLVE